MASANERNKAIAASVVGGLALIVVGYQVWGFIAPAPPPVQVAPIIIDKTVAAPGTRSASTTAATPRVIVGGNGKTATPVSSTGQLDPTLHMEGMLAAESLIYTGTGRNIFAPAAQQAQFEKVAEVKPIAPARPQPTQPTQPINIGPPPPQPVNLKFFGTATQDGVRKALLLGGDDVFLASAGDIVQRRYKIINIATNSITVEDMPNTNRQTLPLLANP